MNLLDVTIILIFLSSIIVGYFRGLFRQIFDILGFFLGLIIFKIIYPIINGLFIKSSFFISLKNWIDLELSISSSLEEKYILAFQDIGSMDLPPFVKDTIFSNLNISETIDLSSIDSYIADFIATVILGAFSAIITITIISIALGFFNKIPRSLSQVTTLSLFNKIAGATLGVALGVLKLYILSIVVLLLSILPPFEFLKSQIDSPLFNYLLDNNPILPLILNILSEVGL